MSKTLIEKYRSAVSSGYLQQDSSQLAVIERLQLLTDQFLVSQAPVPFYRRWFGSISHVPGIYLWGGVGSGKTVLMDMFFEQLPSPKKVRTHFYRFMRRIHHELTRFQGITNPLDEVAAELASQYEIICFDEFFVSDITDAMILARILEGLFSRGVVLVATSNVEPKDLYQDGLQRGKFLPAIALLEKYNAVVNLESGIDYRLRALQSAPLYYSPPGPDSEKYLAEAVQALNPDSLHAEADIEVEGRVLKTKALATGVVWFEFAELCDGPRSTSDYIEISKLFQTVVISNVPVFRLNMEDQARRFIGLIDEFYDRNVKLVLSAEASISNLYQGSRLEFEFRRTESRLQEMQSTAYLSREHRA
ncbi:MAG: cell division protein ZapE [Gammaproteobacteria bacterium]|jgi:cell division protein ZapE|nr:cell division protein ZapE [Gammaproteobacteria bacterium]MBT5203317.1 cell division protein ZapE [Gammaproteobacteria bacterium]MBT5600638.1 cell division protein ZapE [Gammaproteobacteria bacterium]MBT6244569.1 cell division protein ZapE [Gammaproteobacteria bacterium]